MDQESPTDQERIEALEKEVRTLENRLSDLIWRFNDWTGRSY